VMGALPEVELRAGSLAIADLHLDAADETGAQGCARWLGELSGCPRLVLLGDLFDAWVGPAHAALPGARAVTGALAALARRGCAIDLVPGNRDFLLDAVFERAAGVALRPRGAVGRLPSGARLLLVHGDELCTLDRGYRRLKRVVRSAPVRWLAPRLPLALSTRLARRMRRASTRALDAKPVGERSMQEGACRALAAEHAAAAVLCGHAHAARDVELDGGPRWIVLDAFGGARDLLEVLDLGAGDGRGELCLRSSGARGLAPRALR